MTIRRVGEAGCLATVIHRTVSGQRVWDRRLDTASFQLADFEGSEADVHVALGAALERLQQNRSS